MIRRIARRLLQTALSSRVRKDPPAPRRAPDPPPVGPPVAASPPAAPEPEPAPPPEVEIDHQTLRAWREEGRELVLLDIREAMEVRNGVLEGAIWIPMNSVPQQIDRLPRDKTVVVYCAAGGRSYGVTHWLREQGLADAWSLSGGAGAGVSAGVPWRSEGPAR